MSRLGLFRFSKVVMFLLRDVPAQHSGYLLPHALQRKLGAKSNLRAIHIPALNNPRIKSPPPIGFTRRLNFVFLPHALHNFCITCVRAMIPPMIQYVLLQIYLIIFFVFMPWDWEETRVLNVVTKGEPRVVAGAFLFRFLSIGNRRKREVKI